MTILVYYVSKFYKSNFYSKVYTAFIMDALPDPP